MTWIFRILNIPEVQAQGVHFLLGAIAPLAFAHLGFGYAVAASIGMFGFAVLKETYLDPKFEFPAPFLWAGAIDLAFYSLGILAPWTFLGLT